MLTFRREQAARAEATALKELAKTESHRVKMERRRVERVEVLKCQRYSAII